MSFFSSLHSYLFIYLFELSFLLSFVYHQVYVHVLLSLPLFSWCHLSKKRSSQALQQLDNKSLKREAAAATTTTNAITHVHRPRAQERILPPTRLHRVFLIASWTK